MKFNDAKFHSMRVILHLPSNQTHVHYNYTLHQQTLEQVRSAKYHGLADNLEWDQHVSVKQQDIGFSSAQFGSCTSAYKGSCIPNIGSAAARINSSNLASLSRHEDGDGGESAEDSSHVDMQAMEKAESSQVDLQAMDKTE